MASTQIEIALADDDRKRIDRLCRVMSVNSGKPYLASLASEAAMNISDKRRQELYDAIHQQVMALRISLRSGNPKPDEKLDYELAKLTEKIWNDQKRVLGIVG